MKAELSALLSEGRDVLKALLDEGGKADFRTFYQAWYTKSLGAVRSLAPDRLEEFRRYYEPDPKRKALGYGTYVIQDYLKNVVPNRLGYPDFNATEQAAGGVLNQIAILASLDARIDSVLADVEAHLQADMQDAELATAAGLIPVSPRAAGALAGVILERHLAAIADAHTITLRKKNPGIADFNDVLKQHSVYDIPTWRKITLLGDLRNLCSHNKNVELTAVQVRELVEGVNWAIKSVF
ncbi:MAG: hypothetical protein ABR941_04410 [Thermoleophilia bacterium]